eukprot:TRINITY_DN245_c0_g1_i2.p1 TRINITY_DN245_c0_g1~~TRINITY_DN245_c0_g1_i2.p1  ORF type:complete len:617 (-),score=106.63 TRINITY_DN245_c0_g1_i2:1560-3410(-)
MYQFLQQCADAGNRNNAQPPKLSISSSSRLSTSTRHRYSRVEKLCVKAKLLTSPSLTALSGELHIPRSSLRYIAKNPLPLVGQNVVKKTNLIYCALTEKNERQLTDWILRLRKWGAEITRRVVKAQAKQMFSHVPKFEASNSWLDGFLQRNSLKVHAITSSHASTTGLLQTKSGAKSKDKMEIDVEKDLNLKFESSINFLAEVEKKRRRQHLSDQQFVAIDDTRIGFLHAKMVIDSSSCHHPKVLSLGGERVQPNFMVPIRGDGSFCIPIVMFQGKEYKNLDALVNNSQHPNQPLLYCFTQHGHTDSEAYSAVLRTSIRHSLPNGGILIHDSDRSHLSRKTLATLANLKDIDTCVVPPGCTAYVAPNDESLNSYIQQSIRINQCDWLIQQLEQSQGKVPTFSDEIFYRMWFTWFRNAYYGSSERLRINCWKHCGLLLSSNRSEDSTMKVSIQGRVITPFHFLSRIDSNPSPSSSSSSSSSASSSSSSSSSMSISFISSSSSTSSSSLSLTSKLQTDLTTILHQLYEANPNKQAQEKRKRKKVYRTKKKSRKSGQKNSESSEGEDKDEDFLESSDEEEARPQLIRRSQRLRTDSIEGVESAASGWDVADYLWDSSDD